MPPCGMGGGMIPEDTSFLMAKQPYAVRSADVRSARKSMRITTGFTALFAVR